MKNTKIFRRIMFVISIGVSFVTLFSADKITIIENHYHPDTRDKIRDTVSTNNGYTPESNISEERQPLVISSTKTQKVVTEHSENPNRSYTGNLKDSYDKNTFDFTLASSSALSIRFENLAENNASYKLTVKNSSNIELAQEIIDSSAMFSDTKNLYLSAGAYKIEIEKGRLWSNSWNGKPYTFRLNISQPACMEEEINDTIQTANIIPVNETIRATSGTKNDIDYFRFTLSKRSSVMPSLDFDVVRTEKGIYSLKFYELVLEGMVTKTFTFRGDKKQSGRIEPFTLGAGTYIIHVSRTDNAKNLELGLHEYDLRISAEEVN